MISEPTRFHLSLLLIKEQLKINRYKIMYLAFNLIYPLKKQISNLENFYKNTLFVGISLNIRYR